MSPAGTLKLQYKTYALSLSVQGGSNMTGTDLCVNKCKQFRSYLNHIVLWEKSNTLAFIFLETALSYQHNLGNLYIFDRFLGVKMDILHNSVSYVYN